MFAASSRVEIKICLSFGLSVVWFIVSSLPAVTMCHDFRDFASLTFACTVWVEVDDMFSLTFLLQKNRFFMKRVAGLSRKTEWFAPGWTCETFSLTCLNASLWPLTLQTSPFPAVKHLYASIWFSNVNFRPDPSHRWSLASQSHDDW